MALPKKRNCIRSYAASQPINRAENPLAATLKDLRVNLGDPHVMVAEKLLHRANVIAGLKQVG